MTVAQFPRSLPALKLMDVIRAARLAHPGHTQAYAAGMTGYTREEWSNWERGLRDPSLAAVRAILGLYPEAREQIFAALLPQGM